MKYFSFKLTKIKTIVLLGMVLFIGSVGTSVYYSFNEDTSNESSSSCVVTINGSRYDVTQYVNKHPGGNVFVCGSDISNMFNGQHDSSIFEQAPEVIKLD